MQHYDNISQFVQHEELLEDSREFDDDAELAPYERERELTALSHNQSYIDSVVKRTENWS